MSPDNTALAFLWQDRDNPRTSYYEAGDELSVTLCYWIPSVTTLYCSPESPEARTEATLRFHLKWLANDRLVWGEYGSEERIILFNTASERSEIIPYNTMIADAGNIAFQDFLVWNNRVISVGFCCGGEVSAYIPDYPTEGEDFSAYILPYYDEDAGETYQYLDFEIIAGNEMNYIGLLNRKSLWSWLDTDNRTDDNMLAITHPFETIPMIRLHQSPQNALSWRINDIVLTDTSSIETVQWELVNPDGETRIVESAFYSSDYFAIEPNGERAANFSEDGIHVYDKENDNPILIPDTEAISEFIWGAVGWYVDD